MLEVFRLHRSHASQLYTFFKERNAIELIAERDFYLSSPDALAIACTENGKIKQLMLSKIQGRTVKTFFIGEFGPYTTDMLDMLCANCSSREPLADQHEMTVESLGQFMPAFDASRLGRMRGDCSYQQRIFKAKINYPELLP